MEEKRKSKSRRMMAKWSKMGCGEAK